MATVSLYVSTDDGYTSVEREHDDVVVALQRCISAIADTYAAADTRLGKIADAAWRITHEGATS